MTFSIPSLLPNKAQPWRMSDSLYQRVSLTSKEQGIQYRRCVVLPSDPDFDFVWNSFYSNKPSNYGIRRIFAIHHGGHTQSFEEELFNQETQSKDPLFAPNWSTEDPAGQRRRIIERWKGIPNRYTGLSFEGRIEELVKTSVLPLWHGFQAEGKGVSICNAGFEIPGKHDIQTSAAMGIATDPGFFGSGIYFAREARYAVDIYSRNSGHVLLAWVSMREPYPVTREDFDKKRLEGKGHVGFYNAHYIPVISKNPSSPNEANYYPAKFSEIPQYDEIVVFQKSQTLPRFWVELQPDLPFEPSTHPSSNRALADFIFKVLEETLVQHDQELRDLLKEKSRALLIHGEETFLSPSEDEFYANICELFKVRGQIDLLARNHLLELGKRASHYPKLLPETLVSVKSYLERGLFKDAWEDLCLAGDTLFEDFDPLNSPLYELIIQILPHITWEKKILLFDKIITPLRALGSKSNLELSLGRWFSQNKHEEIVKEEWWYQELKIPALVCYGKALALSGSNKERETIYKEASILITKPIFNNLPLLDESIGKALEKQDVNSLKRSLQILSKIRKHFCLSKEEREKLVPLYRKIKGFLHQITLPTSEAVLIREGGTTDDGLFPLPYMQLCSEALSGWKTTFEKEEELAVFPDLLKAICPDLEEKEIESFFSFLMPSREREKFFSPPFLLKRFLDVKRESQDTPPLLEVALHRASLEGEDCFYLTPLIESSAAHLLSKNAPDEEILKLYKILSTGPTNSPFREIFVRPFSESRKALFNQMASMRTRSGSRLSTGFEKEALLEQLSKISQEEPSPVAIQGPFATTRYLKSSLIGKLIDAQGNIKKSYADSLHSVGRVQEKEVDLHFKQKPSHPLLEYAIYSLSSRLSGRGVPPSQLVRFEVTLPGSSTKTYPVLVSQTVEGRNLSDVLRENPSFRPDEKQLTEMVLLGLLTRPGDGRASNFIVTPKNELYSIDNDVSFVEPIVKGLIGETVNFCSVLHYLSSKLDLSVIEDWKTVSPDLLFGEWLEDLLIRERYHLSLFTEEERKKLYEEDKNLQFIPQLLLKAGMITAVYTQFHHLLSLKTSISLLDTLKELITLNDTGALNQTGDRLYLAYTRGKGSPTEKLRLATSRTNEQSMTTPQAFKASVGKIPTLEEIEKRELFSLDKVKEEFLSYTLLKQGEVTLRGAKGKQVLEVDFAKMQRNGNPDLEREELVLKGLSFLVEKTPPQVFIIKNSLILTVETLKHFLHPALVHLEIHNCSRLETFQEEGSFLSSPLPIILPSNLKSIEFIYCTSLTSIQIQAPQVESVKISGSPKLVSLVLDIHFFGKIRVSDLPEELIDKVLEKMIGQKLVFYEKILCESKSIKNLITFERASLKKNEWSIASSILNLVERTQGKVLPPPIPKEKPDLSFLPLLDTGSDIEKVKALLKVVKDFQLTTLYLGLDRISNEGAGAFAASLYPSQPTERNLYHNQIGDEGATALAVFLPSSQLTALRLESNRIGDRGAKALAAALPSSKLTYLDLRESWISNEGIKAFATSLPTSKLTNLHLQWNGMTDEGVKALAAFLPLSKLSHLNLRENWIGTEGASTLATALSASQLTNLSLKWNKLGSEGTKTLATALSSSQLTKLYLTNNQIGDEGVTALSAALPFSKLTYLDLQSNQIGDEGAKALAAALLPSKLTYLDLRENWISAKGAKAFASALPSSKLTNLSLHWNGIDDGGAKALAEALPKSRNLTHLNLRENWIGAEGARAFADALPTAKLNELSLQWNKIGDEGTKALAAALSTSKITSLNLQSNSIGDEGTKAIANALFTSQLNTLYLTNNEIGDEGAEALAVALPFSKLTYLDLQWNQIGDEGAKLLAAVLPLSKLTYLCLKRKQGYEGSEGAEALATAFSTSLNLQSNGIGAEGAKAFARTLPLSNLSYLDLSYNQVGAAGAIAFAAALPTSQLTNLNLQSNFIWDEGVTALAASLPLSKLTKLDLQYNQIGVEGAKALANTLLLSNLVNLNLQSNWIGDEGAKAFATVLPFSKLIYLDLQSNFISDEGAKALANALPTSLLTKLDLANSEISDEGAISLASALPNSKLTYLDLQLNFIWDEGAKALANTLPLSKLTYLDLRFNRIGAEGAEALAAALPLSRLTNLYSYHLSKTNLTHTIHQQ